MTKVNSTLMTAALGGLMLAATMSAASADDRKGNTPPLPDTMGECHGVNSCKGTSSCKTALSKCKGKNSCKGMGWTTTSAKDCTSKGGKIH